MNDFLRESSDPPDHDLIPTSLPVPTVTEATVALSISAAVYTWCPAHEHQPEGSHSDHAPVVAVVSAASGLGSTGGQGSSGDPLTWQNSSMFDAAIVASRLYRKRLDEQFHTAAAASRMMASNNAVLFGQPIIPSTTAGR